MIEALRFTARGIDWGAVDDISSLGHWKLAAYTAGFILLARLALAVLEKLVFHGGQDLGITHYSRGWFSLASALFSGRFLSGSCSLGWLSAPDGTASLNAKSDRRLASMVAA